MANLKVALVHDYLKEYGGAERVLQVLHEMFPEAPIYIAFYKPHSTAAKAFDGADVRPSWANLLIRSWNLYSPLRFLTPLIWESFDFSSYDLVILSSSWFITKPIRIPKNVKVICYCHTPPRSLYGYPTAVEWQRYRLVKIYFYVVSHYLRLYDFLGARRVDQFVVNSENVAKRVRKFYRRESVVIYPPVEVGKIKIQKSKSKRINQNSKIDNYLLVVGRIAGAKGVNLAMEAFNILQKEPAFEGYKLKIAGEYAGIKFGMREIEKLKTPNIEFLGRVSDEELYCLYAEAQAFLALGQDEDFGITPVEAMVAGAPVVAYKSGGYLETVSEGKTGTFFEEYTALSLADAIRRVMKMKFDKKKLQQHAERFSKERFVKKFEQLIRGLK